MHWKISLPGKMNFTPNAMSRKRFDKIKSHLHVRDNNYSINGDKLIKVRPLIDYIGKKIQEILIKENLCIDEQMVHSKGLYIFKLHLPNKPKK